MATNFHLAPPPKTVDGLNAVPIDIQTINVQYVFDGMTSTATGDATISYTVGPTGGFPIFDLRQPITQAWVDGVLFPVAQMALHDFGADDFDEMRIVESMQAAGSVHTLRVQYTMAMPLSKNTGDYPPEIGWSPGPKLNFAFGLSDLRPGRYAEAWMPANLIFDQFTITIEAQVINTMAAHSVITNGVLTNLGVNHWRINYPERFTALSPMLEIRASDLLTKQTDTVMLPVSGKTVTIDLWKFVADAGTNLTTEINNVKGFLVDNENKYGPYLHETHFTGFINKGGMEYEGGTTTGTFALRHETFHSWFARGVKPAGQADGWWDEAFNTYHDSGASGSIPFSFIDAPRLLCSREPYQRRTPMNSYTDGEFFFNGLAAKLGVANLNNLMRDFYNTYKGNPASTQMLEEFLLSKSGNEDVVDCFHRYVYGMNDPSPVPDLWMKDDPAHTGDDHWDGVFWDSPDLWIRNGDDDDTTHQEPEFGQDNWFHARVRNRSSTGTAQHFVVTFHAKPFAGTEFIYPNDFLPCITAKAEFDLGPLQTRIVKARWPSGLVPPEGTHTCMLASVITRSEHPVSGRHVWEHNNLAQKNLTVVNMHEGEFIIVPVVIDNLFPDNDAELFSLEIWRDKRIRDYEVALVGTSKDLFRQYKGSVPHPLDEILKKSIKPLDPELDCGGHAHHGSQSQWRQKMTSHYPELIRLRFPEGWFANFAEGAMADIPVAIRKRSPLLVGVKVSAPKNAKPGTRIKTHFVQRHVQTKRVLGGISVEINIV